jgi:hypothetical protein
MLSYKYKLPGIILFSAGIIMTILFFTLDFRIEIPVLALVSSYMETKFFVLFKTNFADELIILTLLAGLSLVAFSEEKTENEMYTALRSRSFAKTAVINTLFMAFSVIFIYGAGFMSIIIADIFLPFITYLILFNSMKRRLKIV